MRPCGWQISLSFWQKEPIMKEKKEHWYKIYYRECPVCGRHLTWRERVYGPKPKDPDRRYEYVQTYDWCFERESLYM
jgi:hypothetical protein